MEYSPARHDPKISGMGYDDQVTAPGSSLVATEQKLAPERLSSTVQAPEPQKETSIDPEGLLLGHRGSGEPQSLAHVEQTLGNIGEASIVPHPSTTTFTPRAGTTSVAPRDVAETPWHQRRASARVRLPKACEGCRRRKIKCDGGNPCSSCQYHKVQCLHKDRASGSRVGDELAIKALETIERRGRDRYRDDSPPTFQNTPRALSHSPDSQFYHSEVEEEFNIRPLYDHTDEDEAPNAYQYVPLPLSDIRLLRITPGKNEEPLHCTLKILPLQSIKESTLEFQALSYAWAHGCDYDAIFLSDASPAALEDSSSAAVHQMDDRQAPRPFRIHKHLSDALKRIREHDGYTWIWVDALCIDQKNEHEKSHQIPKMPDIYSNAWNVIVWLGEPSARPRRAKEDMEDAVGLIPRLLNLKILDSMLQSDRANQSTVGSWVSFMEMLDLPWFTRRWVIQEIACAKRLSLRIGSHVISWIDFADAVELFLDKLDRMRELYSRSQPGRYNQDALTGVKISGAKALMELSRNIFRKSKDSQTLTRLMDLEALVLSTNKFAVTEVRDVIYALLYLAKDITGTVAQDHSNDHPRQVYSMTTDYSRHPVDIFSDFVLYCIVKSQSLNVICRHWATWPRARADLPFENRTLPSWIGVKSFLEEEELFDQSPSVPNLSLVGAPQKSSYTASASYPANGQKQLDVLEVHGLLLGTVSHVSSRIDEATITDTCLQSLGWTGSLNDGLPDKLWRALVANRTTDGRLLPGWYRRACALALTKLTPNGDLNIPALLGTSLPSTLVEYLKRVREVVHNRRIFQAITAHEDVNMNVKPIDVGLGPKEMLPGDVVCVLFGCSVPVVLRPMDEEPVSESHSVKFIGEAYLHDNMEGEVLAGTTEDEVKRREVVFRIH